MNETSVATKKLRSLDALRGVAAILIFLLHFWYLSGAERQIFFGHDFTPLFSAGGAGLDMFFVLSGFLIFRSIYFNGVNKKYFIRRFLRIVPIYYFSLIVFVIFFQSELVKSIAGLWNIASHFLFLQSFDVNTYYGVNPVLWSLSVEMIFYMFLPVFFIITGRSGRKISIGVLLMILIAYFYRYSVMNYYDIWNATERLIYTENFIGRLDQFAFGIIASFMVIKLADSNDSKFSKWMFLLMTLVSIVGLYYGFVTFDSLQAKFREIVLYQVFLHSALALFTATFIIGITNTFTVIGKVFGNAVLRGIGMFSYSFYIWHSIVIEKFMSLDLSLCVKFIVSFACVVCVSAITYYLIEKPFLKLKKY